MREVDATIGTGGAGEEGRFEFPLMNPDRDVSFTEVLQSSGMVQVEMADDDLFDVLDVVARLGNGCFQLVFRLVPRPSEDIVERSTPHFRVVLATASLPKNQTFGGMLDKDRVHDEIATLGLGRPLGIAHERSVASAFKPTCICLQIAQADDVSLGAFGRLVEDVRQHDAVSQLVLGELARHGCELARGERQTDLRW